MLQRGTNLRHRGSFRGITLILGTQTLWSKHDALPASRRSAQFPRRLVSCDLSSVEMPPRLTHASRGFVSVLRSSTEARSMVERQRQWRLHTQSRRDRRAASRTNLGIEAGRSASGIGQTVLVSAPPCVFGQPLVTVVLSQVRHCLCHGLQALPKFAGCPSLISEDGIERT
jgi:hypothetical protein